MKVLSDSIQNSLLGWKMLIAWSKVKTGEGDSLMQVLKEDGRILMAWNTVIFIFVEKIYLF